MVFINKYQPISYLLPITLVHSHLDITTYVIRENKFGKEIFSLPIFINVVHFSLLLTGIL